MPVAVGIALKAQVIAAQVLIGRGNTAAARVILRAAVAEIDLLVRLRVLKASDVAPCGHCSSEMGSDPIS